MATDYSSGLESLFRNNYNTYQLTTYDLNPLRWVEFVLCLICFVLVVVTQFGAPITPEVSIVLTLLSVTYSVITITDIIATSFNDPIFWNSWIIFSLSGALFFFLCVGVLISALGSEIVTIGLVAAIFYALTATVFLFDAILNHFAIRKVKIGSEMNNRGMRDTGLKMQYRPTGFKDIGMQTGAKVYPKPGAEIESQGTKIKPASGPGSPRMEKKGYSIPIGKGPEGHGRYVGKESKSTTSGPTTPKKVSPRPEGAKIESQSAKIKPKAIEEKPKYCTDAGKEYGKPASRPRSPGMEKKIKITSEKASQAQDRHAGKESERPASGPTTRVREDKKVCLKPGGTEMKSQGTEIKHECSSTVKHVSPESQCGCKKNESP